MSKRYVVAVDQSTSASKVFLVDAQGQIVRRFSGEHRQFYPQDGYVEHDATEILQNVLAGIKQVTEGVDVSGIAALAISNQRETTVLWDRITGEPLMHAIVWQDVRGQSLCDSLHEHAQTVKEITGLELSPYYPAAKAAAALKEDASLRLAMQEGRLCMGTIDSWLVFHLTGGKRFVTDVSNASRTQLFDLKSLSWSRDMCDLFGIDPACLPEVLFSDGDFGTMQDTGIPITGVMGDSHAALFGQGCHAAGQTKATFGTGSSVMMNVGTKAVLSHSGLSSSVGFGFEGQVYYVLEGNVTCCGDTLCWLRDELQLIDSVEDAEGIARKVENSGGVYLVPAFSGLGAPYFDGSARAILCGMNRGSTRAHIVRAALESMAYQDADILQAMQRDMGSPVRQLRVDGGPTKNALLMQCLSDLAGCEVVIGSASELSALGAAYMAGIRTGLYASFADIPAAQSAIYSPEINEEERCRAMNAWASAVQRAR